MNRSPGHRAARQVLLLYWMAVLAATTCRRPCYWRGHQLSSGFHAVHLFPITLQYRPNKVRRVGREVLQGLVEKPSRDDTAEVPRGPHQPLLGRPLRTIPYSAEVRDNSPEDSAGMPQNATFNSRRTMVPLQIVRSSTGTPHAHRFQSSAVTPWIFHC